MKNYKQWVQYKQSSTLSPESWPIHDPEPSVKTSVTSASVMNWENQDDFGGAQVEQKMFYTTSTTTCTFISVMFFL